MKNSEKQPPQPSQAIDSEIQAANMYSVVLTESVCPLVELSLSNLFRRLCLVDFLIGVARISASGLGAFTTIPTAVFFTELGEWGSARSLPGELEVSGVVPPFSPSPGVARKASKAL